MCDVEISSTSHFNLTKFNFELVDALFVVCKQNSKERDKDFVCARCVLVSFLISFLMGFKNIHTRAHTSFYMCVCESCECEIIKSKDKQAYIKANY